MFRVESRFYGLFRNRIYINEIAIMVIFQHIFDQKARASPELFGRIVGTM